MIIYGRNSVREALNSETEISTIYIRQGIRGAENQAVIDLIKKKGIQYKFVTDEKLDALSNGEHHQGFVAQVSDFAYSSVDDIINYAQAKGEQLFIVLLDGIKDVNNLGNIIRSCECAGVHGIVIEKVRACEVNATAIKVSAGASSHMKIARVANIVQVINRLKKMGVWTYSIELGGQDIYKTNLKGDVALVIGSEGEGTRRLVKESCDVVLSLPMRGKVNSLNASNATAIALYEVLRQRLN